MCTTEEAATSIIFASYAANMQRSSSDAHIECTSPPPPFTLTTRTVQPNQPNLKPHKPHLMEPLTVPLRPAAPVCSL